MSTPPFGQDDVNGLGGIGEGKVLVAEQVIRRLGHDGEKRGNAQEKRAENRKKRFMGKGLLVTALRGRARCA